MTLSLKASLTWLILCVVMFANGAIRALVLQPRLGEDLARQVASLTGVLFVLLASWLFVRAASETTSRQLLWVGAGWLRPHLCLSSVSGSFLDLAGERCWPSTTSSGAASGR